MRRTAPPSKTCFSSRDARRGYRSYIMGEALKVRATCVNSEISDFYFYFISGGIRKVCVFLIGRVVC